MTEFPTAFCPTHQSSWLIWYFLWVRVCLLALHTTWCWSPAWYWNGLIGFKNFVVPCDEDFAQQQDMTNFNKHWLLMYARFAPTLLFSSKVLSRNIAAKHAELMEFTNQAIYIICFRLSLSAARATLLSRIFSDNHSLCTATYTNTYRRQYSLGGLIPVHCITQICAWRAGHDRIDPRFS